MVTGTAAQRGSCSRSPHSPLPSAVFIALGGVKEVDAALRMPVASLSFDAGDGYCGGDDPGSHFLNREEPQLAIPHHHRP
jgi:hypothetical protein